MKWPIANIMCHKGGLFVLQAGEHIYERGSKNGKRVQSNMGAKNHGVIMPDANKEATLNAVWIFVLFTLKGANLDIYMNTLNNVEKTRNNKIYSYTR